jgi:hypothetical protein
VHFELIVDGQRMGDNPTLGVGQAIEINTFITGATFITLEDICSSSADDSTGSSVTAVWINARVGAD